MSDEKRWWVKKGRKEKLLIQFLIILLFTVDLEKDDEEASNSGLHWKNNQSRMMGFISPNIRF